MLETYDSRFLLIRLYQILDFLANNISDMLILNIVANIYFDHVFCF